MTIFLPDVTLIFLGVQVNVVAIPNHTIDTIDYNLNV